ncbi:hypothetical protein K474DRAFT_251944 [Panus rudis PR-1116 ss-1]|nr:hypothetical protein K474DRAFT_251944 [Panus rudis PR-1116 ss-1]
MVLFNNVLDVVLLFFCLPRYALVTYVFFLSSSVRIPLSLLLCYLYCYISLSLAKSVKVDFQALVFSSLSPASISISSDSISHLSTVIYIVRASKRTIDVCFCQLGF